MKQLTQQLKSGQMAITDVSVPIVSRGQVLVRNHYSLISAGTEGSTVKTARKSLIGKAKERPQQVKQVLDVLKKQGPTQTYRAVMKKLDAYSPLGYSSAGVVIEVGDGVTEFVVGDRIACAGAGYANHADIVAVPVNLCVKLSSDADLDLASYNTLGAIALQGIRQADLRLGETCAVIGLGLIGQLTCLMLRASGIQVYGIDLDSYAVKIAKRHCCDHAWERAEIGIADKISGLTNGLGVDAVIITAGTSSLDPVNFAGEIARKKGRVVVVGAVPTGFDRDPYYYKKELELRMSCSYGPGRYDLEYEEKGIDYPPAYVRWTEKRNMVAFQDLVYSKRIDIDYLTTHEVTIENAPKAYDMILERSEPFLGIVIKYDLKKQIERKPIRINETSPAKKVGIGFIGAGSYAQSNLLPNIPMDDTDIVCQGVMTNSGTTSRRVAEKYGFGFCASEEKDIVDNDSINTVFIATRHDSHASYVKHCLEAGKHVFVEKPLCLTEQELNEIVDLYHSKKPLHLMVGFNRRFAPLVEKIKSSFGHNPMAMLYRINAGAIPPDTWIQDKDIGGGRIVGEVCHFVDLMTYICGSLPIHVNAYAIPDPHSSHDSVNINMQYENGSIGTISYFANGAKSLEKEYLEVYQSGQTAVLKDFKELQIYGSGKPYKKKLINQDKGQRKMVKEYLNHIKEGGPALISIEEIARVTQVTFAVHESLKSRQTIGFTV